MTKGTIIVVDDDVQSCQLITRLLSGEGYGVDQAYTGKEALKLLKQKEYQVVLLDIRLPDMSGLDLLAALKKAGRKTEVIIHTAYASLQNSIEALNQGALSYIMKPFQLQEVRLAVRRAIEKRTLETENERLLEDLKKKNRELEAAYRELGEMTGRLVMSEKMAALTTLGGGIAHELNNPLTSILGMVTLLLEKVPPGSEQSARLNKIRDEVRRCARIIKDLLTFTREVSGGREDVDCNQVLQKTIGLLEYQSQKAGVKVGSRFAPQLPMVRANPPHLGQVFLNLLLNALESVSGKKEPAVELETNTEPGAVVIRIKDNGRGISRENLTRIFEPFFTTKEPGKGSGMGLAVCQGIIDSLGGKIKVESQIGRGSVFTVTIPPAEEQPPPSMPPRYETCPPEAGH